MSKFWRDWSMHLLLGKPKKFLETRNHHHHHQCKECWKKCVVDAMWYCIVLYCRHVIVWYRRRSIVWYCGCGIVSYVVVNAVCCNLLDAFNTGEAHSMRCHILLGIFPCSWVFHACHQTQVTNTNRNNGILKSTWQLYTYYPTFTFVHTILHDVHECSSQLRRQRTSKSIALI